MTLTSFSLTKQFNKYPKTLYNSISFLSIKKEFTRIPFFNCAAKEYIELSKIIILFHLFILLFLLLLIIILCLI